MSSFIGHALSGAGIYATTRGLSRLRFPDVLWVIWLAFVAVAPDLDYIFPSLYLTYDDKGEFLRTTHSIAGSLVFPLLTVLALTRFNLKPGIRRLYGIQVVLVGLSHVAMDLLVGVSRLPLLWPFAPQAFVLPFGILPSGPAFRLDNVYMYRNLLIEIGVLLPLYAGIYLTRFSTASGRRRRASVAALWLGAAGFMGWAFTLAR